jgi:hypothetical protein
MDATKIIQHNKIEQIKRDANRREGMKLRPLDKNYGQRYFVNPPINRGRTHECSVCNKKFNGGIIINGTPFCDGCFINACNKNTI